MVYYGFTIEQCVQKLLLFDVYDDYNSISGLFIILQYLMCSSMFSAGIGR